jgi:hypothetical protein
MTKDRNHQQTTHTPLGNPNATYNQMNSSIASQAKNSFIEK